MPRSASSFIPPIFDPRKTARNAFYRKFKCDTNN